MVAPVDENLLARHLPRHSGNLYELEIPAGYLSRRESDRERQSARVGTTQADGRESIEQIDPGAARLSQIIEVLRLRPRPHRTLAPRPA